MLFAGGRGSKSTALCHLSFTLTTLCKPSHCTRAFAVMAMATSHKHDLLEFNYRKVMWIPHPDVCGSADTIPLWLVFIIQWSFDYLWGN